MEDDDEEGTVTFEQLDKHRAFAMAMAMMDKGVEPTSALKEAGRMMGLPWGDEMKKFVEWGYTQF